MPQAPAFWWTERPGPAATLLHPFGRLYGAVTARRMRRPGTVLPVPVLCVGNFVTGGAGKTPTALAFAALLAEAGHRPAFLSRGYGRRIQAAGVLRVDCERHTADETGDEPMLLAAAAPTYVSPDRVAAGRQAIADGATVLVLDDGLQNPSLSKTVAVSVIDGVSGVGNGLCVPAGPLRAPLAAQWPLVSALCLIGRSRAGDEIARQAYAAGRPVLHARIEPDRSVLGSLRDRPLVAFAGIGQPAKFFATLDSQGLTVRTRRSFPDHHRFTADELRALEREAARQGAQLVTTAKDGVRLPRDFPACVLPVTLRFDDPAVVERVLRPVIARGVA